MIVGFSIDHTNKETTEKFEKKYGDKVSWRSIILAEESKALGVSEKGVYAWVFNNRFYLGSKDLEKIYLDISLDDVLGYERLCELEKKKISIGKAIVGGAIFGPVGAILGGFMGKSKKKKKEVILLINYKGEEVPLILNKISFDAIEQLLPNKKAQATRQTNIQGSNSNQFSQIQSNSYDELEQLAQLRDKGIITDDEFNLKKKQILGL